MNFTHKGRPGRMNVRGCLMQISSDLLGIFCNLLQPKIGNLEAESMSHTL